MGLLLYSAVIGGGEVGPVRSGLISLAAGPGHTGILGGVPRRHSQDCRRRGKYQGTGTQGMMGPQCQALRKPVLRFKERKGGHGGQACVGDRPRASQEDRAGDGGGGSAAVRLRADRPSVSSRSPLPKTEANHGMEANGTPERTNATSEPSSCRCCLIRTVPGTAQATGTMCAD